MTVGLSLFMNDSVCISTDSSSGQIRNSHQVNEAFKTDKYLVDVFDAS